VDEKPRFLWLALGDTDEWAHRWDYRRYLEALTYAQLREPPPGPRAAPIGVSHDEAE